MMVVVAAVIDHTCTDCHTECHTVILTVIVLLLCSFSVNKKMSCFSFSSFFPPKRERETKREREERERERNKKRQAKRQAKRERDKEKKESQLISRTYDATRWAITTGRHCFRGKNTDSTSNTRGIVCCNTSKPNVHKGVVPMYLPKCQSRYRLYGRLRTQEWGRYKHFNFLRHSLARRRRSSGVAR